MKFFETSKYHFFKKSTYISLRWIGIIGQLISVNFVYFFLNFDFNFIICNLVIFFGVLSNLFLIFIYKKTQLSDRSAFIFLVIDILQLGALLYLTGGITNPFVIFLLVPSIFSSSNLSLRTKDPIDKSKAGLGLGLFIGKTLLEKNFASINCRNSKTRGGAEVIIKWNNKDLFNI